MTKLIAVRLEHARRRKRKGRPPRRPGGRYLHAGNEADLEALNLRPVAIEKNDLDAIRLRR